jgi:hypothetical protein
MYYLRTPCTRFRSWRKFWYWRSPSARYTSANQPALTTCSEVSAPPLLASRFTQSDLCISCTRYRNAQLCRDSDPLWSVVCAVPVPGGEVTIVQVLMGGG